MIVADFPRDLVTIGIVFGVATLVWAGWAQERPPSTPWRVVLGVFSVLGLALVGVGIPAAIRTWSTGTAIEPGTTAFVVYVVAFWAEVVVGAVGAVLLYRRKRGELVAPLILLIVGIHFAPLAFVFGQGVLMLAAVLLCAAAVVAVVLRGRATPSFWCGVLAAPVFLALGLWSLLGGLAAA
jgi:hypothetical protein